MERAAEGDICWGGVGELTLPSWSGMSASVKVGAGGNISLNIDGMATCCGLYVVRSARRGAGLRSSKQGLRVEAV